MKTAVLLQNVATRSWVLRATLFCFFCGTTSASIQLLNGQHAGVLMHSPAASEWCGPSEFRINTLDTNASLVDGGDLSVFCNCDGERGDRRARAALVKGKTVLVSLSGSVGSHKDGLLLCCAPTEAYLNLVDAGSLAVIVFNDAYYGEPGMRFNGRSWETQDLFAARDKAVPFAEVSRQHGINLREMLSGEANEAVYLLLSSDNNTFIDLFGSWAWILVMRVLVPVGFVWVTAVAFRLACLGPGLVWGTTKHWVVNVELVFAAALAFAQAMGAGYFEALSVPRKVNLIFSTRFSLCGLLTTFLVCRFWRAHAKALGAGKDLATADPQTQGWIGSLVCWALLLLEGVVATLFLLGQENRVVLGIYFAVRIFGEIGALAYLAWSCGSVLLRIHNHGNQTSKSKLRMATYLFTSCVFIAMDITASVMILSVVLGLVRHTPVWWFTGSALQSVARIGTSLCQLSVFLPRNSGRLNASVVPASTVPTPSPGTLRQRRSLTGTPSMKKRGENPMDTHYLVEENARLKLGLKAEQLLVLGKAALVEALERKSDEMGGVVMRLASGRLALANAVVKLENGRHALANTNCALVELNSSHTLQIKQLVSANTFLSGKVKSSRIALQALRNAHNCGSSEEVEAAVRLFWSGYERCV